VRWLLILALVACRDGSGQQGGVNAPLESRAILDRSTTSSEVQIKQVQIGWKDLAGAYRGRPMDPRAANRTARAADKLARELASTLVANPGAIDTLAKKYSEDGIAGATYTVTPTTTLVPELKQLALRLLPNEVGVVRTHLGYHVVVRVTASSSSLEHAEILTRPPSTTTVYVQTIEAATKPAHAEALFDEQPGRVAEVSPTAAISEPLKSLALRLREGEIASVEGARGWLVVRRIARPASDSLESADVLAREPPALEVTVQHVLLGWADVQTQDPRGHARTRAELETLVTATLARLAEGEAIERVMAELSEDPDSASSGTSYVVTAATAMPERFKQLALRLRVNEIGVARSLFGMHVVRRTK